MPSTVYKGDLAEVSFAPETGLMIRGETDARMTLTTVAGENITTIAFTNEANLTLFEVTSNNLKYPKNMLVGSQVIFEAAGSSTLDVGDLPDTGNGGRIFTIVENSGATIKITPAMITATTIVLASGDTLHILPYKTPPMDVAMTQGAGTESVKTDQFLGIATALTLPETKVDLKRFHVVGLGRDAAIQVPGKLINEGGSFEVAMHSARWLKYCLGHELIFTTNHSSLGTTLSNATFAGQSHVVVASKNGLTDTTPDDGFPDSPAYIEIRGGEAGDTSTVPIVSDHEPDGGTWDGTLTDYEFDSAKVHEIRRIIGISENDNTLYLDEPLTYPHAASTNVELIYLATSGTNPVTISSTGTITNPVEHLLYSRTTQPSFALEVSQRRRDIDSDETDTDGGVGDSKELTRVFRGCKVTDWTMTTDNDAALRLSVNFNAALCYTDTGRLENTPITRYASHRMFDDTANTEIKRIESGIGKGTQKPFMFYNGSITLAGQQVAQVLSMTLTGQTGMQSFHTVNGHYQASSAYADQVPFAGARNASLMVEGQTTYEKGLQQPIKSVLSLKRILQVVQPPVQARK